MVADTEDATIDNMDQDLSAEGGGPSLGETEQAGGFKAKKIMLILLPILILLGAGNDALDGQELGHGRNSPDWSGGRHQF